MTQDAQEWQDELADIVTDSLDIDWNANVCAGHLLANGVYPPSVVAELVDAARDAFFYVNTSAIPCNGWKCREPWCPSCFGEEDAYAAVENIKAVLERARNALNNLEASK